MLSTFIIDDEHAAVDLLKSYVERTPFLELVGSTTNPIEAIHQLHEQEVDLVFLDIHMPYISGIDLMKLMHSRFKVILTTAFSEHALEGFEYNVLDYLLKPVTFERFLQASQKALYDRGTDGKPPEIAPPADEYIWVKTENKGKMVKINLSEIVYVEGLKNYLSIFTPQDRIIILMNIKDLEEHLPKSRFMRVHKSYIIALPWIRGVDCNQILLKDMKAFVPLGETYRSIFFKSLEQFTVGARSKSK